MQVVIGVDPGTNGAICVLDITTDGNPRFLPAPSAKFGVRECVEGLVALIGDDEILAVAIEDVHSIFGMSANSNFNFGKNVGMAHAVIDMVYIAKPYLIQPKKWQTAVGAPTSKQVGGPQELKKAVAQLGKYLYPTASLYGPRGGLMDGRSDSLMIAHSMKVGGT
jgi:hypothetical protein